MIRTLILLIIFFVGTSYTSSGLALGMFKIWKGDVVVSSTSKYTGCRSKSGIPLNAIISGDLRIEAGANLAQLDCIKRVTGSVVIKSYTGDVTLANLTTIGKSLEALYSSATAVSLPGLTSLGENLFIFDSTSLTSLELPKLTQIGGFIEMSENTALTKINASALTKVTGEVYIKLHSKLLEVDLSSLQTAGSTLYFAENYVLETLDLSSLTDVGGKFSYTHNGGLSELNLPLLTTVGSHFVVWVEDALETLTIPSLTTVAGYVYVGENPLLETLEFSALTSVGDKFYIVDLESLTLLTFPELTTVGNHFTLSNNPLMRLSATGDNSGGSTKLTSITGNLLIHNNAVLPSVQMLINSLNDGTDSTPGIQDTATITDNPTLPSSEAQALGAKAKAGYTESGNYGS